MTPVSGPPHRDSGSYDGSGNRVPSQSSPGPVLECPRVQRKHIKENLTLRFDIWKVRDVLYLDGTPSGPNTKEKGISVDRRFPPRVIWKAQWRVPHFVCLSC